MRKHLLQAAVLAVLAGNAAPARGEGVLDWQRLPDLPDQEGFAGVYAGVVKEAEKAFLIVAGGANFPGRRPWEGGSKVYHDGVFALELGGEASWSGLEQPWPVPVAYGMSVGLPQQGSCLFLGGKNVDSASGKERALSAVWEVRVVDGRPDWSEGPSLPVACVEGVAALVENKVIVAAGATNRSGGPEDGFVTSQRVFMLDTGRERSAWEWSELPWPEGARGRMYAVAGTRNGKFYIFGGRDFAASEDDAEERISGLDFLRDCYELDVEKVTWRRLADLPEARSAAPSNAVEAGASHLLFLGGVPVRFLREQLAARPELNGQGLDHPGFPDSILAYDTVTNTWAGAGRLPRDVRDDHPVNPTASTWATVTTPVVSWDGGILIPTGEIKPGVRSPQVLTARVVDQRAAFGLLNWIVVGVYLLGMVAIGYWFMRRKAAATTEAYFRGGQHIPFWVAGLSIFATMLSSLTFMGIPARAYQTDVTWYLGQLPILIVVPLVVFCYLPFFRKLDLTSAYLYLERRFNLAVRLYASLSFILYHIGRIAIVLYLPALALAAVSNIGVVTAILIIGVLCVIYTVMGGIEAVVWTDAVQAMVLMGGAILCLVLVVFRIDGGAGSICEIAVADEKLLENLRWDNFDVSDGTTTAIVLFVAFLFNSLVPYTSGQDVVQRYVTTRDIGAARKSLWTTMWVSIFGSMVFFGLGVAIYAFYKTHPAQLDPALPKADSILPFFIMQQLPVGVSGLVIAAVFAASQSTVSSSLNSVATTWVKDFDARLIRPDAADQDYLKAAKWVVVLIGTVGIAVAIVLARSGIESAFKTFQSIIGLTAGSLGGLFALGVFTRRANGRGAVVGALAGFATVMILKLLADAAASRGEEAAVTGLLYAFIGFTVCFAVGYLASIATGARGDRSEGLSVWSRNKAPGTGK
jgi:SSS family transporter